MSERIGSADVVIIGGGVIGCALAWELARRGVRVSVVEREVPGRAATWAAAGMLSPYGESRRPGPFLELAAASLARYRTFADELARETGMDLEYREDGKLQIALDSAEAGRLAEQLAWQRAAGIAVERLEPAEARRREPALSPQVCDALFLPRDFRIDNRRLGRALWAAAAQRGVAFHLGTPVTTVLTAHGRAARGVMLASGAMLEADRVVLAAGCWSGQLAGLPRPVPVVPVRGQMLAVEHVPPLLASVVLSSACYLIPRAGGRVLVGATVEHAGYAAHVTPAGMKQLLDAALRAVPALGSAAIMESWAGLRPGTPDELPILGADPECAGLLYATGHYRNGILLAPITAELMATLVLNTDPALPLEPFAIDRFARSS